MAMPKEAIEAAIKDRLEIRWKKRCLDEMAAPVCVIGIKQLAGPDFGVPVVCTLDDMPTKELADLLFGISRQLRTQR